MTVTVLGDAQVKAKLDVLRARVHNLIPAWREFARVLRRHNRAQFLTQGLQGGKPWAPLSPAYAAWKLAHYGPRLVLQRSGDLMEDLTGTPMGVERYTPRAAEFGTDIDYAKFHDTGTRYMPARKPMVTTPGLRRELNRVVAAHLTDGL